MVCAMPGIFGLAAILPHSSLAAEDYTKWSHSADLYMDTSPDGANVVTDVYDFPVLVRLKGAEFPFAQARKNGEDIRLSKPDGTHLAFEIERYDSAAHMAEIWVKLDTVKGNFKGQFARLHWGSAAAPSASSPSSVFAPANGFHSVWHLGGQFPTPRLNAVSGGADAVPVNYDNNESTEGAVGLADSLDGATSGDYLQVWDNFSNLDQGFTYSIWAYPTAVASHSRLMDFGNGSGVDNLILKREGSTQDLTFQSYNGTNRSFLVAKGALLLNQWQYFAVTVSSRSAKIYRNGALVASGTLTDPIGNATRADNYIGRSNWSADEYFMGKLDEPTLATTQRSADWIKLCYANQRTDQNLVSFTKPPLSCTVKFAAPADTSIPEAGSLELAGTADCASSYLWTVLSGPAPKILDPEVKSLHIYLPRVVRDTTILYRFSANFGTLVRTKDVAVRVVESIPEPALSMPASMTWNGQDSLLLKPTITNMGGIKSSKEPSLHYAWTLTGMTADTIWRTGALMLKSSLDQGSLNVGLCVDNNGSPACQSTRITVSRSTSLAAAEAAARASASSYAAKPAWDAAGRRAFRASDERTAEARAAKRKSGTLVPLVKP